MGRPHAQGLGLLRRRPQVGRKNRRVDCRAARQSGPILSLCPFQLAPHANRAHRQISRPLAGGRLRRLGRTDQRQRRPDSASAGRGRFGRQHAGHLFLRQRARGTCLRPGKEFRSSQRRALAGRGSRSVGGGPSCPVHRPLAGPREARHGQRWPGQPGRPDGHRGRRRRVELPAGSAPDSYNLLPLWTQSTAQPTPHDHPSKRGRHVRGQGRHEWLWVAAKSGGMGEEPDWFERNSSAIRRTTCPASCTISARTWASTRIYTPSIPTKSPSSSRCLRRFAAPGRSAERSGCDRTWADVERSEDAPFFAGGDKCPGPAIALALPVSRPAFSNRPLRPGSPGDRSKASPALLRRHRRQRLSR